MPDPFGGFGWICAHRSAVMELMTGRHTPLPQCNIFLSQLWRQDSLYLSTLFPTSSEFYSTYSVVRSFVFGANPVGLSDETDMVDRLVRVQRMIQTCRRPEVTQGPVSEAAA